MEDACRTFDTEMRERRRQYLAAAAASAGSFLSGRSQYRVMVSGSLSRGQVHPWSDLDLVLIGPDAADSEDGRADLRHHLLRHLDMDMDGIDVVFPDEIAPGLAKGMLGSLVAPGSIPELGRLPDPMIALARVHVSVGYALKSSEKILEEYFASEKKLRAVLSDFDSMVYSHAMDPLRRKALLWLQKLAVFIDGGRSEWLDDRYDEDALDRLLARLASSHHEPFARDAVIDTAAAGALRYLLVDAYDFVVRRRLAVSPKDEYEPVVDAIRDMARKMADLAARVETHGLSASL